ncbi:hypothetical protein LIP_0241 [Limnochorda pilosa]|uniref:DUF1640 domain-containing protein n=1 Tax=Limnochorda pilosa TaxID=1555112 RepID=A0A0K2SG66_LIMPI|nr:hypothetical protein LIP_0241 [Limnochorda pilosa]
MARVGGAFGQVDKRLSGVEVALHELRTEMRAGDEAIRQELGQQLLAFRGEFKSEMAALRDEFKSEQAALRDQLRAAWKSDVHAMLRSDTRWIVTLVITTWISLMAAIWLR